MHVFFVLCLATAVVATNPLLQTLALLRLNCKYLLMLVLLLLLLLPLVGVALAAFGCSERHATSQE